MNDRSMRPMMKQTASGFLWADIAGFGHEKLSMKWMK